MNIHALQPSELDAALALNNANVPALSELDALELQRLAGLAIAALAAEVDGAFAGFCIVLPPGVDYASLNYGWFSGRYSDFAYLDRIAVDPAFRRFGVGRGLYAALVEQLTGVVPVLLCEVNTRPRNDDSLEFHRVIGFREVGTQDTDGGAKTVSLLELRVRRTAADSGQ